MRRLHQPMAGKCAPRKAHARPQLDSAGTTCLKQMHYWRLPKRPRQQLRKREVSSMRPVVIAVAITGSVPRKKDNPAVPVTPSEQIESTHQAFEAGATLVHIHVRNPDESPSSDPERFARVQEGVVKHCPGMIVQFSTGGRGRDPGQRGSSLSPQTAMALPSSSTAEFP